MLPCTSRPKPKTKQSSNPPSEVTTILNILLTSPTRLAIEKRTSDIIHPTSWTTTLAQSLLSGLVAAIENAAPMAEAATKALQRAIEEAYEFAKEHPVYTTILALGVLALLMPWVLEVLGFSELGPVEGSFAAWWQARYAGYVPKGSFFSYLQRLGMVWKKKLRKPLPPVPGDHDQDLLGPARPF
ncbi:hypothetical protein BJX61DRAFT_536800 [Aspergillus egyptiacus]|nr:hypothetical protein BJX61DRAFT_536800 [Aspergillus egyptiacus]